MMPSYPKIYNLGHNALTDLFLDPVLVEEKVDGSQFSFGRINGELFCRSKGCRINVDYPEKMFGAAVEVVKTLDLKDGLMYRGEYLQKPKHNALAYDRIPKNHIIIFDINPSEECYLSYDEKLQEAKRIGLEVVPLLYNGMLHDPASVLHFLERTSVLGGQKIEGIVIKNYSRFGRDKKALMGKYVSEAFKEVHSNTWKVENKSSKDILQLLTAAYLTPARWNKAIQHLKENGTLTQELKDIPLLLREIQKDVELECEAEIKQKLYDWARKDILRGVIKGFPEFYKEYLLRSNFENLP